MYNNSIVYYVKIVVVLLDLRQRVITDLFFDKDKNASNFIVCLLMYKYNAEVCRGSRPRGGHHSVVEIVPWKRNVLQIAVNSYSIRSAVAHLRVKQSKCVLGAHKS